MGDTNTPYIGLTLPQVGVEDVTTPCGTKLNNNFTAIDLAIGIGHNANGTHKNGFANHSQLANLNADDHPQYYNSTRLGNYIQAIIGPVGVLILFETKALADATPGTPGQLGYIQLEDMYVRWDKSANAWGPW